MTSTTLKVYRGDTKTYNLTFTDSASAAIDITGYTVFFTVKEKNTDTDANAKISKTVTSHSDATNGITTFSLTTTETDLEIKSYHYDIQLKDDSGNIITCVKSTFEVSQDITLREA